VFLKSLTIKDSAKIIRTIEFHKGINFIVDETPDNASKQTTGNNVGKTTVLRLIDFCFGEKGDKIYKDTEFKKSNINIENFLQKNNIQIILVLTESFDNIDGRSITIRRNFLHGNRKIQEINGNQITNDVEFCVELKKILFGSVIERPTFRQIVSKNIRDEKDKMDNILKTLHICATSEEYEALYLFWLGIEFPDAAEKSKLRKEKRLEENVQKRLNRSMSLSLIEQSLSVINRKIAEFDKHKAFFNLNSNYAVDIEKLNSIKDLLNKTSANLEKLELRKTLILENQRELEGAYSNINISAIKMLYDRAHALIPNIQKSFEDTLSFHNGLISQKLKFITKELPQIEIDIRENKNKIKNLFAEEQKLTDILQKNGFIEDIRPVLDELNKLHEKKGQLEEHQRILRESIDNLRLIDENLSEIDRDIRSKEAPMKDRITAFNVFFSDFSDKLYGESYLLIYEKNNNCYDLKVDNVEGNPSAGKKKGQIAAFDFAYISFADSQNIKCLHFILHDRMESMHDNQLKTLIDMANNINGQYIVPILRDKIPEGIDVGQYEVLRLSQEDKLFRIP